MTVLILGGTAEARQLAGELASAGTPVVTSLAGSVESPSLPEGEVRIGGFGGVEGLIEYLREHRIDRVVDATHPFAATITANAAEACARAGVPLLRLSRPGWEGHPGASGWHWVADMAAARDAAASLGRRAFLSVGRGSLVVFIEGQKLTGWADRYVLARVIDDPPGEVPPSWEIIRGRGPFTRESEVELMRSRRIDVLVTKNSGGAQTAAKLDAAADLGIEVVMVARPPLPEGAPTVDSVDAALTWVLGG